jgi:hypothetical protein
MSVKPVPHLNLTGLTNGDPPAPLSPAAKMAQTAVAVRNALTPRNGMAEPPISPRKRATLADVMKNPDRVTHEDLAHIFRTITTPRQPASPRPIPVEEPNPTKDEVGLMEKALAKMYAPPVLHSQNGTSMGVKILRSNNRALEPVEACITELRFTWGVEIDSNRERTRDEEVVWSLAKKTIKQLSALSQKLLGALPKAYEVDPKVKEVLLSPRKPKDKYILAENQKVNFYLTSEDQVLQRQIPDFVEVAKGYYQTLDILTHRHDNDSLFQKHFGRKNTVASPRSPRPDPEPVPLPKPQEPAAAPTPPPKEEKKSPWWSWG